MTRGRGIFKVLLVALIFAAWAFVGVGYASATEWHVYPGQSIQTAINSAGTGDTIYVHAGTYVETVNVTKRLALIGVGKPVIDAGGNMHAITLSHDSIVLDGFIAINANIMPHMGIFVSSNSNVVINCTVSNTFIGIELESSSNNTLTDNIASNNTECGIDLYMSSNNILIGNIVNSNNFFGIGLKSSSNNTLIDNIASNNDQGIYLGYSSNNNLEGNIASNNYQGIMLMSLSNYNTLTGNTANSNTQEGINLYSSSNNTLTGNTANSNNHSGIHLGFSNNNMLMDNTANLNKNNGIYLGSSSTNTLSGNTVSNNYHGIELSSSSNSNLTGNNASYNNKGIRLGDSGNNNLKGNTANSNTNYGIYLQSSNDNHIYNNFFDNALNAYDDGINIWNISKTPGTNIIGGSNLGGNYWSDYMGEDTNGDGLGDTQLPHNSSRTIINGGDWLPLVIIINQPPTAIIDSLTPNPAKQGKDTVSFIGHGNDSDGSVVAYNWTSNIDGLLNTSPSFTKPASELSVGTHNIYFIVQDNDGAWSFAATEILTITTNQPPVASFSYSPVNPAVNETIIFNASASYDSDGNIASYNWSFGDGNIANTTEAMITHAYASVGEYTVNLTVTDNEDATNRTSKTIKVFSNLTYFDTEPGTYPSIPGTHNGTIKMTHSVNVSRIYLYPCAGTGGHIKYARISNASWDGAEARWNGYIGDWHNLPFDKNFTLVAGETYNYTIQTGSYPQIHHTHELLTAKGWIACTSFVDINGKRHEGWIPAIRLS